MDASVNLLETHHLDDLIITAQLVSSTHSQLAPYWSHIGTNTNYLALPSICRAASLGPEDGALHRPVPEQAPALPQIKKQDSRPSVPLPTRRRDPRSRRGHHQDVVAADLQASQTRPSRDFSEPAWAGLSRSMSEGAAAAQPWITKSPNTQVRRPTAPATRIPLRIQAVVCML